MARLPLLLVLVSACSPEVLLATSPVAAGGASTAGASAAGANSTAGSGGAPSAGSGGVPSEAGAEAGGEAGAGSEPPRILADSVADFSLVQGEHGWYYGYDDGTSEAFTLMTYQARITNYIPATDDQWDCWAYDDKHWTQLFELGGHANGVDTSAPSTEVLQRAVRRWVSTFEGDVSIVGEVAKIDVSPAANSNGIDASVVVDGVVLDSYFVGGQDAGGWSYELPASLALGSKVDFVLDPHDSSDHHDLTRFTAVITRAVATPSP
jgi:hypothetical protein